MKIYGEMGINKYREMNDNRVVKGLRVLKREGILIFGSRFLGYCHRSLLRIISPLAVKILPRRYFNYNGSRLEYFQHPKNLVWTNERGIEIPIIIDYIKKSSAQNILEVGAVLPHYYPQLKHDVVDKFEKNIGIINEDIITFHPSTKYDLIVSISTLEHVGFEDDLKDSEGILKAINNLKENCLAEKGKIIITLPLGYNKDVDRYLFDKRLGFSQEYYFKKKSVLNTWEEINPEEARKVKFDRFSAQGIVIGIITS